RDGMRHLGHDLRPAALHESRNRRTAGRLRAEEPWRVSADESRIEELAESLAQLAHERAPGHGRHHGRGKPPPELLGDLEGDRLGALPVVAAQVDVHDAPAKAIR